MKDTLFHENFDHVDDPDDSPYIRHDDCWDVRGGNLFTNGGSDGSLAFKPVAIENDAVELSFRIKTPDIHPFEHSDFLRITLHVEGYGDILLDEFRRDGDRMVGSESGQAFADDWTDLSYLTDQLPDGATNVTLKFESHISAGNEKIYIDDVKLAALDDTVPESEGGDTTDTLLHEDFDDIHDPDDSPYIRRDDCWDVYNDMLFTSGGSDGTLEFKPVTIDHDSAELTFRIKTPNIHPFEHSDFLRVSLHVEGYGDIHLDTFRVDGGRMVGSESGQSFGEDWVQLSYLNDELPEGAGNVTLKFESHISWHDEKIFIDNVKLTASHDPEEGGDDGDCEVVTKTLVHEDFDHLHEPEDSAFISTHTRWDVQDGKLFTNAHEDGVLEFDPVTVAHGSATLSFTAKSADPCIFETHQDFLKVYAHIEGQGLVLLDVFETNGHAFVGSITGQRFDDRGFSALSYEVDLPEGPTEVTFKFESFTTQSHEWFKLDDLKVEADEKICDLCPEGALKIDFEGFHKGDDEQTINAALEHVTITAVRNGREAEGDVHLEAEHMHEHGFHTVWAGDAASGHRIEKLSGHYGKLFDHFDGADGTYELKIALQDEADGQSWLKVTVGHEVKWIRLDGDGDGHGSDHGPFSELSIGEFDIHRGDQVKVEVWRDGNEYGRIDALKFHRVDEPETGGDAMIFDTDHITGGDHDLAAGDGKVLIISEDNDSSDPDDEAHGGAVRFDFDVPVTLYTLDVVDTEEGGTIELFDAAGEKIAEVEIPEIADNTTATVDLGGVSGVSAMVVTLDGSGALDNLCYDKDGAPETASLGDRVWFDGNRNGLQDDGETGVAGVTVTLVTAGGDGVFGTADDVDEATQTTDANGNYLFTGLAAGAYQVVFSDIGPDRVFTVQDVDGDASDADDSDADETTGASQVVTLAAGETNLTVDAGLVEALGALSGRYFCDENNNDVDDGDAAGDMGIVGVLVTLLDATGQPVLDDAGQPVTTQTGTDGTYSFEGLVPGTYGVRFEDQPDGAGSTVLAGKQLVADNVETETTDEGTGDQIDSDAIGTTALAEIRNITVEAGAESRDNDAGAEKTASLGNFVFLDADADGIQDAGESGIAGVTVTLTGGGADGVIGTSDDTTATTTTDANGAYAFTGLNPGEEYQVAFDTPTGFVASPADEGIDDTIDSDGPVSDIVTLAPGEDDPTIDQGFYELAGLGDFVFFDADGDGLQDAGEAGAPGVAVELKVADGAVVRTTTTDANGGYSFTGLTPGTYSVAFTALAGFAFTTPDAGADDLDSDADPATGMTQQVTLASGDVDLSLDAGLVEPNLDPTAVDDMLKFCAPGGTMMGGMATTGIATVDVLANDSDPDSDTLTIAHVEGQAIASIGDMVTLATGATVKLVDEGGTLVLQYDSTGASYDTDGNPATDPIAAADLLIGMTAQDSFKYSISDDNGGEAVGTVTVDICGAKNTVETITASLPDHAFIDIDLVQNSGFGGGLAASPVRVDFDGDGIFENDPDSPFDGVYEGFCIELPDEITEVLTEAVVYSAYDDPNDLLGLAGDVDFVTTYSGDQTQANADAVSSTFAQINYLLDRYLDGNAGSYQETLDAIRALATDETDPSSLSGVSRGLYDDALLNADWEPEAGDFFGVIFQPNDQPDNEGQVYIVGVPFDTLAEDCIC